MPEGNINAEVADHLREHGEHRETPSKRRIETIEILEAILLAIVAIAHGAQRLPGGALGRRERPRVRRRPTGCASEANEKHLEANQTLAYDAGTLNAWLQAYVAGDEELQAGARAPLHTGVRGGVQGLDRAGSAAEPGRARGSGLDAGVREHAPRGGRPSSRKEASHAFEEGVEYRETGEHYVRVTVILAAVLFLVAIGQRFTIRGVRLRRDVGGGRVHRLLHRAVRDLPAPLRRLIAGRRTPPHGATPRRPQQIAELVR